MRRKITAFFSSQTWRLSFSFKRFIVNWLSVFAVIWTITDFIVFFVSEDTSSQWKPPLWVILLLGIIVALWFSRPRLTRTIKIKDRDITLRITVDDMFRKKGVTTIIPVNVCFQHEYIDEKSVQVQYRNRHFAEILEFDRRLQIELDNIPYTEIMIRSKLVKQYAIGTVVRIETPNHKQKSAYLVATAELNEYGKALPNHDKMIESLDKLWEFIGAKGSKESLILPVVGSGRNRLIANRYELIYDIVKSFLKAVKHNKFTEELTIVIHPDAFLRNKYSLDDIEEFLRYVSKFEVV